MGLFRRKKKNNNQPENFFNVPRNDAGFEQIVSWLHGATELILDLDDNGQLQVFDDPNGEVFLAVFTGVDQHRSALKEGSRFTTIDFFGLKKIFDQYSEINFIWLNPQSDSVRINRSVFTSEHMIKKDTEVQIGLPEIQPTAVIDWLVAYCKTDNTVSAAYLGLLNNNNNLSYLIYLESPNNKEIVSKIGPKIAKIIKNNSSLYPVDFTYENLLSDEQYLIYRKE